MMRVILSLILSLVLALASGTMAVARTQASAFGQITICSGYGIVTVSVDAEGNPVGPVHPCPDCLTGVMLAGPLPMAIVASQPLSRAVRLPHGTAQLPGARAVPVARARGPPQQV